MNDFTSALAKSRLMNTSVGTADIKWERVYFSHRRYPQWRMRSFSSDYRNKKIFSGYLGRFFLSLIRRLRIFSYFMLRSENGIIRSAQVHPAVEASVSPVLFVLQIQVRRRTKKVLSNITTLYQVDLVRHDIHGPEESHALDFGHLCPHQLFFLAWTDDGAVFRCAQFCHESAVSSQI